MSILSRLLQLFFTLMILTLTSFPGLTHTTNESTLFPDIKDSNARFDVILLVGIGIIPETEKFNPDEHLNKIDLAAWGALAKGLVVPVPGEKPDVKGMAAIALEKGLTGDQKGNASYADINKVLFNGKLRLTSPDTVPTRAEAAEFIVANLETNLNGATLLSYRDMEMGPTGKVTEVVSKMNPDGGSTFYLSIGNQSYAVYSHGKLANGPVDLKQWDGKEIRRSIVRNLGQFKIWVFLEAGEV